MTIRVLHGDCREVLKTLPDRSVQMVCTSPPYYGLRSYLDVDHTDKHMEIGTEPSPEAYIAELVAVFREVRRVLRDDGTVWLNLGDSYAGNGVNRNGLSNSVIGSGQDGACKQRAIAGNVRSSVPDGLKPKDLLMIPARVAIALQADGWYLRSDTIWHKPNPMPESCTDRPTSSHEHVFLLTKNARYYYDADAVREESDPAQEDHNRRYAKPYAVFDDKARETRVPGSQNSVGIHSRPARGSQPSQRLDHIHQAIQRRAFRSHAARASRDMH